MTPNLQSEFRPYLEQGESLLWADKPNISLKSIISNKRSIIISAVYLILIAYWLMSNDLSGLFSFMGLPLITMIMIFNLGKFILNQYNRKTTVYGMTENRIIILRGSNTKKIQSIKIKTLKDIECLENKDGSGTIYFGIIPENINKRSAGRLRRYIRRYLPKMELIPNVRKVYNQIIELQNQ